MTTAQTTALDGQLQGYLDHLAIERGVAANTISSIGAICVATAST